MPTILLSNIPILIAKAIIIPPWDSPASGGVLGTMTSSMSLSGGTRPSYLISGQPASLVGLICCPIQQPRETVHNPAIDARSLLQCRKRHLAMVARARYCQRHSTASSTTLRRCRRRKGCATKGECSGMEDLELTRLATATCHSNGRSDSSCVCGLTKSA